MRAENNNEKRDINQNKAKGAKQIVSLSSGTLKFRNKKAFLNNFEVELQ